MNFCSPLEQRPHTAQINILMRIVIPVGLATDGCCFILLFMIRIVTKFDHLRYVFGDLHILPIIVLGIGLIDHNIII